MLDDFALNGADNAAGLCAAFVYTFLVGNDAVMSL